MSHEYKTIAPFHNVHRMNIESLKIVAMSYREKMSRILMPGLESV